MQRTRPETSKADRVETEADLKHIVPGAYLIRAGSLTVDQVRDELKSSGLIFVRRFLAYAERSDYLALFDQKILVKNSDVESTDEQWEEMDEKKEDAAFVRTAPRGETPAGSWAALAVSAAAVPPTKHPAPVVVVGGRSGAGTDVQTKADTAGLGDLFRSSNKVEENLDGDLTPAGGKKKIRPGRTTRQMLKALVAASDPVATPQAPVIRPLPPVVPSAMARILAMPNIATSPAVDTPAPVASVAPVDPVRQTIPPGATLLITGSETGFEFRLRPFRVGKKMEADQPFHAGDTGLVVVPHLTVYLAPRYPPGRIAREDQPQRGRDGDAATLAHVEKCHNWIKRVLNAMAICGALPDSRLCRVMPTHSDASRLSRANVVSLQCRFRPDVDITIRNSVYAVLRSAVWYHSLVDDNAMYTTDSYLVRCWWRQVPASAARDDV